MFDEQPDGDLHGECAAEIHRLQALSNETLDFLAMMFDAYEEGPDCYEDPEDCSGHIGKAIHLDDEAFQRIADILNEHRPRNTAVSPAPTFADGMTAEDDRRFLEATSGLDSYELPRCFRCGHLLHAGDCVNVAPYNVELTGRQNAQHFGSPC